MAKSAIEQPVSVSSLGEAVTVLQDDYHLLDNTINSKQPGKLIIGHKQSAVGEAYPSEIRLVELPKFFVIFRLFPALYDLLQSLWLIGLSDGDICILINGGHRFGMLTCLLNSFIPIHKRKILLWELYIPNGKLKKWIARRMILGSSLTIVYSKRQLEVQAGLLHVPSDKLLFLPYKANDSISPPIEMRIGGYIFSGGTSRRDYHTLFEAVRNTGIPVVVSTANSNMYATLDVPDNVIFLTTCITTTAFTRLMAASSFVVIPINPGLARGAGEATLLNAMWHGKAVICADDICAFEYIEDGVTGYVTPPGDAVKLRERIIELWNQPEKAAEMGHHAHKAVVSNLTAEHFNRRLRALGILIAASK